MRVYISADGEGISSLVSSQEMYPGAAEYEFGRRMMTHDVNAAIAGAFDAGATYVLVNDAHWNDLNILPTELDGRAEIIRGSGKPLSMMEGIQDGFDAAFFVGYHAKVGASPGVANETVMGKQIYDVRVNGVSIGELEINAAVASHFNVPVTMVSGDDMFAREVAETLPNTEAAVVKYAIDKWSARCLSPDQAFSRIRTAAATSLQKLCQGHSYTRFHFPLPARCEVEFISTAQAKAATVLPGSFLTGPRSVAVEVGHPLDVWKGIFSLMLLGSRMFDDIYG